MADEEQEQTGEETKTPAEAPENSQQPTEERGAPDTPNGGGEPPQPPDETQSTVQAQASSERDIEKAMDKLGREAQRHRGRIGEIMGEDALALLPCELCWPPAPGFRFPQIPEDQRAAVMLAIGFEPEPDFRSDTQSGVCPDCDGWGQVATGSKVQGQKALPCTSCKGKGWRGPREQQAPQLPPVSVSGEPSNGPADAIPLDPDREAARQAAQAAGFMVIDTRAAAAT